MPHQCVHCSKILEIGSKEILEGCNSCGGKFFFYIRDEQAEKIKASHKNGILKIELPKQEEAKLNSKREIKIS